MRQHIVLICLIGLATALAGTPPSWAWVQRTGGTGECRTYAMLEDSQGRIVVSGYFTGTVEFGGQTLISNGGRDAFVAQMDAGGNWLWAVGIGGAGTDYVSQMALGSQDQIMVGGSFDQSFSLEQTELINQGQRDIFLAELSSVGQPIRAEVIGSAENEDLEGLAITSSGEIYLCGSFRYSLSIDDLQFSSSNRGFFLAKLEADMSTLWGQTINNATGDTEISGLASDNSGNIYLTGYFTNFCSMGAPNTIQLTGDGCCGFIVKLDPNGSSIWGERVGNGYCIISSSYTDPSGNTYISAELVFEPMFEAEGKHLDYIPNCGKLGADGEWVWVDDTTNLGACASIRICGDSSGNCYITGFLWDNCSFGEYDLTGSFSSMPVYVAAGNPQGEWQWGIQTIGDSGTLFAFASRIIPSQTDRCIIAGSNNAATINFGDYTLPPAAQTYTWIVKTNGTSVGNIDPAQNHTPATIAVYPNPSQAQVNFRLDKAVEPGSRAELYNLRGQVVKRFSGEQLNETELIWDGKDTEGGICAPGLYFLRIRSGKEITVKAFTRL
ncbi:MAG TPA: T9SS type A sorting domain-containing protein [Candidatus Cloacimonadota bacterium]|nr:T9SS type A sorting domain-containing protein [Candidatus Cloacimonadota bacterium]